MSKEGVTLFRQCIDEKFYLQREGREWLLEDNWVLKLKTPRRDSLGFRLDEDPSPFRFFRGSPPEGVAKMCDAIIALSYKGRLYIFLVEQKTKWEDDYEKQLKNGKYFCDWLLVLLREHGRYKDQDTVFIGLLCMRRSSPGKELATHRKNEEIEKIEDKMMPFELYKAIDREMIYLAELIGNA